MKKSSAEAQLQHAQLAYRREAEQEAEAEGVTPAHVLEASAEYDPDHELTVRSIGPAVVIVVERDAPIRHEVLAATRGEMLALRDWLESNPTAAYTWASYLEAIWSDDSLEQPDLSRANEHAARLEKATRTKKLCVGGERS